MNTRPKQLDKYELRELLGRGGMAEVWKAYDSQLHRFVAVKLLHTDLQNDPDFLTRFAREAQVIAGLRHPNIVQVYDFQTSNSLESTNPLAYMVMEYIEGPTLAEYIRRTSRQGRFPSSEVLIQMFAAISRAIDYAHAQGMIHRDIKPSNILLDKHNTTHLPDGEPILSDFGIARLMGASTGEISRAWMGTPLYTSPEQAEGKIGSKYSDLYSLAVILYEICTGAPPFRGDNIPAIVMQQANAVPVNPSLLNPNISPALSQVIIQGLAKDPLQRYPNAAALTIALAEALQQPVPKDLAPPAFLSNNNLPTPGFEPDLTTPTIWSQGSPSSPEAIPTVRQYVANPPTPPPYSVISQPGQLSGGVPTPVLQVRQPTGPIPMQYQTGPGGVAQPISAFPMQYQTGPGMGQAMGNLTPVLVSSPYPVESPPALEPVRPQPVRRKRHIQPVLIALLALLLVASGLGGLIWFTHNHSATPAPAAPSVLGHIYFASSGQISEHSSQGSNDIVTIDLQSLAAPASGNAYYGWLLSDANATDANSNYIPLGKLTLTDGSVHQRYSDPKFTNLLGQYSRFLITEESASASPEQTGPTPDRSAWRYYAAFPNEVKDSDGYTLLAHLRHLMVDDPTLDKLELPGGLDTWFYRNSEKVMEWSGSARDYWEEQQAGGILNQTIRVLDYLDGLDYVTQDVPASLSPGDLVNRRDAMAALLKLDPGTETPKPYIFHINSHLQGITASVGATDTQRHLAGDIDGNLNRVEVWLEKVRADAKQIMQISNAQGDLLSPQALSLLDDMETNARYAFLGDLDTSTNQLEGGVTQVYYYSQELLTMSVTKFTHV